VTDRRSYCQATVRNPWLMSAPASQPFLRRLWRNTQARNHPDLMLLLGGIYAVCLKTKTPDIVVSHNAGITYPVGLRADISGTLGSGRIIVPDAIAI
jgi:hypothetical protein